MRWLAFFLGLFIVLGTAGSLTRTLVLPRALASRLSVFVGRGLVYRGFIALSRRLDSYEAKDRLLAYSAPMALVSLLFTWFALFLLGFGLMLWKLTGASFLSALRESGSSMLTLGIAGRELPGATVVYYFAAFTGLITVALLVGYLPTLYGAFNRREVLVTMLQSRAGAPAWGPEIVARAQMTNLVDELAHFYSEWERWCAEVMESHTTYTVLLYFRSPHPLRSWILAMLAVMDSAAMFLALAPSIAPSEARLCLRMGFTCLRAIADSVRIPYDPDPLPDDPIELTRAEFEAGVERAVALGFVPERSLEEAWKHFRGWRVNYESIAYRIADGTMAPPGPWSGPRRHLPGIAIVPQRPPNRQPEDPHAGVEKASRPGYHA